MRSYLLQQLTTLILPLAALLGSALVLRGHDQPGGGFDAGLAFAMAAVLAFAAFGVRRFRSAVPLDPERIALLGGLVLLGTLLVPQVRGEAGLTHDGVTMLLFEVGVVLVVAGSLGAAALWLWEADEPTPDADGEER